MERGFVGKSLCQAGTRLGMLLVPVLLSGCLDATPERAQILGARMLSGSTGTELEVDQQLRLSAPMLAALDAGIPLRLVYRIDACAKSPVRRTGIELRHSALTHRYELRRDDGERRYFARRSALLAALDRVRLPLHETARTDCEGSVRVALDLTSLPTPLRLPALLRRDDWRLASPPLAWSGNAG